AEDVAVLTLVRGQTRNDLKRYFEFLGILFRLRLETEVDGLFVQFVTPHLDRPVGERGVAGDLDRVGQGVRVPVVAGAPGGGVRQRLTEFQDVRGVHGAVLGCTQVFDGQIGRAHV